MASSTFAEYACDPLRTKGRIHPEKPTPYRSEYERDRDRIIHSNAFRRLQYKTQVFINHEGDHYRNRLTHSVEVSSVARSLAKALDLSDDLAESVGLAHDLGHSPFGHAGEDALNEAMEGEGGFSHNAHSLKILTELEKRYAAYDGLNLTWEVLEGIVKHNGPLTENVPEYVVSYDRSHDLDLSRYSSAEAQVASLSDDVAYICHDLEDGIRSNVVGFSDLSALPILDFFISEVRREFGKIEDSRLIYEAVRKLAHRLIEDMLAETRKNIESNKIETSEDVRNMGSALVDFGAEVKGEVVYIKKFLFGKIYRHEKVAVANAKSKKIVKNLFEAYINENNLLPEDWSRLVRESDRKKQLIADYIAGMTDRFAINEYERIYRTAFKDINV